VAICSWIPDVHAVLVTVGDILAFWIGSDRAIVQKASYEAAARRPDTLGLQGMCSWKEWSAGIRGLVGFCISMTLLVKGTKVHEGSDAQMVFSRSRRLSFWNTAQDEGHPAPLFFEIGEKYEV
jgi:hypothetical protein